MNATLQDVNIRQEIIDRQVTRIEESHRMSDKWVLYRIPDPAYPHNKSLLLPDDTQADLNQGVLLSFDECTRAFMKGGFDGFGYCNGKILSYDSAIYNPGYGSQSSNGHGATGNVGGSHTSPTGSAGSNQANTTTTGNTGSSQSGSKSKSEKLIKALEALGMTFKLNRLEDNVEVDGKRLDDITQSDINLKLIDDGFTRPNIADAINVLAGRSSYDPVEDYLLGLQWDGKNHLAAMMHHFTGDGTVIQYDGQDVPLHASLIGRWLTGAVARGLDRGKSAFNHQTPMLVIIGPQGIGKSSWVRWLTSGVGYEFHRESMVNPHNAEDIRSMVTKWIWELSGRVQHTASNRGDAIAPTPSLPQQSTSATNRRDG